MCCDDRLNIHDRKLARKSGYHRAACAPSLFRLLSWWQPRRWPLRPSDTLASRLPTKTHHRSSPLDRPGPFVQPSSCLPVNDVCYTARKRIRSKHGHTLALFRLQCLFVDDYHHRLDALSLPSLVSLTLAETYRQSKDHWVVFVSRHVRFTPASR